MRRIPILASLRRHAAISRVFLAVLLAATAAVAVSGATAGTVRAGSPPNRLDNNGGRVLEHPAIHNLYMSRNWDGENPANFSSSAIDAFTQKLVGDGYFDGAGQYGVHSASFTGSDGQASICPSPILDGETDFGTIIAWMVCETTASPVPFTTLTGIPGADDNSLYVVYVPVDVQINDVLVKTCDSFGAYHFNADTPSWDTFLRVPFVHNRDMVFAVIPAACAHGSFDLLTALASHEIIEAATDPDIAKSWIDNSQIGFNSDILKQGEAADICEPGEGDVPTAAVQLPDGLLVSPYWSNNALNGTGACVPIVRHVSLDETGLPNSVPHNAIFDGNRVVLPFNAAVDDGSTHTYSFPSPVSDPNTGIRYITSAQPTTIDGTKDVKDVATYSTQYLLTVNVSGLDANSTTITNGATNLGTASTQAPLVIWLDGGPLALDASANVNGPDGTQYFFQGFSPAASTALTAPFTTTAVYKTMAQLVADALASEGIIGPDALAQANGFIKQFAAVQADMGGHNYARALIDLLAFITHAQMQSGIHLTASTAQTFQLDALLVYHNALCLALTAGQINLNTANSGYAFYSSLTARLGGTVLPPC